MLNEVGYAIDRIGHRNCASKDIADKRKNLFEFQARLAGPAKKMGKAGGGEMATECDATQHGWSIQ